MRSLFYYEDMEKLQRRIRYNFKEKELLYQALKHRSLPKPNNERMEFLGDSILNSIIADLLYRSMPDADEGNLTRCRMSLVSRNSLSKKAEYFQIQEILIYNDTNIHRSELAMLHPSILENTMEAIIGAIYLDSGWENTYELVSEWFHDDMNENKDLDSKDSKSKLQEFLQRNRGSTPEYELISAYGPDHAKVFKVKCTVQCEEMCLSFSGEGHTKRAAEQVAAEQELNKLKTISTRDENKQNKTDVKTPKARLKELIQKHRYPPPKYILVGTDGPDHFKHFRVECLIEMNGEIFKYFGEGQSKRIAEHEAAQNAINNLF